MQRVIILSVIVLVIYADVLLVLNAYVDYILILSTEKIFNLKVKLYRRLIGSFVGALTSLAIFIPIKSEFISILIGIVTALIISAISFGVKNLRLMFKSCLVMYLMSCTYGGVMLIIWRITKNSSIVINNSIVYFNISPLFLIISTVVCYFILCIISKMFSRRRSLQTCTVDITLCGRCISLKGMIDTGNTLHDQLSGLPVIIIDSKSAYSLIGADLNKADTDTLLSLDLNGFRIIPLNSVIGGGSMPAFRPDNIMILIDGEYSFVKAYIAVSDTEFADGFSAVVGAQSIIDKEKLSCC